MPSTAIAKKKYAGQSGQRNSQDGDRQEEPYIVSQAAGISDAISAVLSAAVAAGEQTIESDDGTTLSLVGTEWDFIAEAVDGSGTQAYEVRLVYASDTFRRRDVGDVQMSYDTLGGSIHVTMAQTETVYSNVPASNRATFNKVIGNQGDSADGTDITVPVFNLTIAKVFKASNLPQPGDVFWLTGKYNAAPITFTDSTTHETITLQAGELTFKGARHPVPRSDRAVEMTFEFFGSPNLSNITIADITGIDKKGSQYLWLRYDQTPAGLAGGQVLALKPKYVVVNDVLYSGDFNLLRI